MAAPLGEIPSARFGGAAAAPSWARWNRAGERWYTVGAEEELMLLNQADHSLAQCSDAVLARLSDELRASVSPETHAAVVELTTGIHANVSEAVAELAALRRQLALELSFLGLAPACAAMHPTAPASEARTSGGPRYQVVAETMRSLAHREPTMALHVHVGIPDPACAVRVLNRLRESVPVLLALSANSPFSHGSDTGFCSMRTLIFGGFPRTGLPRAYTSYSDYVAAVDDLVAAGAFPDATFLWWDVRLQPALGTVEVRVMDAQTSANEIVPLAALVQSLARRAIEAPVTAAPVTAEVLEENRFLAARDGLEARVIDPRRRRRVPVRAVIQELLDECRPHAVALGCVGQLEGVNRLATVNGAARQRFWAAHQGVASIAPKLVGRFASDGIVGPVSV